MEDGLADCQDPIALEPIFEDDNMCTRCSTIRRDFTYMLDGDLVLDIDLSEEEWEAKSCKICRLIGFAMADKEAWLRARLILRWRPYLDPGMPFRFTQNTANPNAIGTLSIFNINSQQYAADRLELVKCDEDDIEEHHHGQRSPNVDFPLLKAWISNCDAKHQSCNPQPQQSLKQLRIIDVKERNVKFAPENCEYVALSYVWGQFASYSHLASFELPNELPLTIEDSLRATQMLGYNYLWIDQFCIDQHDPSDMATQVQQMGTIYAAARATLVACAGQDPTHGLPGVSIHRQFCEGTEFGPFKMFLAVDPNLHSIVDSVWATRGWTLQEGLMSNRLLFFTDKQVVYVCQNNQASQEAYKIRNPVNLHKLHGSLNAWVSPARWDLMEARRIITQYSTRHLSFEKDALDAITGIWGMFEKHNPNFGHMFGMPFATHPLQPSGVYLSLPWIHTSPAVRRPEFPSWSFLGWKGAVEFKRPRQQPRLYEGMIEVFENDLWHPLGSPPNISTEQFYNNTPSVSPLLKMNVMATEFGLEYITWNISGHDAYNGFHLILPWSETYELCIEPIWDDATLELDKCGSLLCVVLVPELAWDVRQFMIQIPYLLVLRSLGDHYQRIGCYNEPSVEMLVISPKLRSHGKQFRTKQNKLWTWRPPPLRKDSQHPLHWTNKMERKTFLLG